MDPQFGSQENSPDQKTANEKLFLQSTNQNILQLWPMVIIF